MEPIKKELVIRGQQIYLRPITADDTELAVRWRNEPTVVENFIYRKPVSRKDHEEWLTNKVFKGLVHQFIICRSEDAMPLGSVYLQNFEDEHKRAESGIYLGEEQVYGKGIGTEAVKLMADYAFGTLGLHKLSARVLAYNMASRRLHEKAGYVQEAHLKDELFLEGKYEDLILFGAVNPRDH
ncbi:MAG: GNAT family N-acetyltransferase [Lachnospiraceae bacterium]|nr:GNAT family N-acetyltransferase [Lachnospiraceae bacterium]MDE7201140.1 GNAT family N-acetyltransferase [Lachnospiraceae bacterium]